MISRPSSEALQSAIDALRAAIPSSKGVDTSFLCVVHDWLSEQQEQAEQDEEDDRADDAEARRERDLNDAAHNGSR